MSRVLLIAAVASWLGCAAAPPRDPSPEQSLDFGMPRLTGGEWQLSAERGRPVLLHFFAMWCEPCKVALPRDEAVARKFAGENLAAYAVSVDANPRGLNRFIDERQVSLPVLLDSDVRVADGVLKLKALPATFLFDAQGRLRYRSEGEENEQPETLLEAALTELLSTPRTAAASR